SVESGNSRSQGVFDKAGRTNPAPLCPQDDQGKRREGRQKAQHFQCRGIVPGDPKGEKHQRYEQPLTTAGKSSCPPAGVKCDGCGKRRHPDQKIETPGHSTQQCVGEYTHTSAVPSTLSSN